MLRWQIRDGRSKLCSIDLAGVQAQLQASTKSYLAHAGILSRKKLALDPRLVTTLCRLSPDTAPRYSEPLDPDIGGSGVGRSSSGSFTTRIVESVKSLPGPADGSDKTAKSSLSRANTGLGNGGISELPRALTAVIEDLLTREDSKSHVV